MCVVKSLLIFEINCVSRNGGTNTDGLAEVGFIASPGSALAVTDSSARTRHSTGDRSVHPRVSRSAGPAGGAIAGIVDGSASALFHRRRSPSHPYCSCRSATDLGSAICWDSQTTRF